MFSPAPKNPGAASSKSLQAVDEGELSLQENVKKMETTLV